MQESEREYHRTPPPEKEKGRASDPSPTDSDADRDDVADKSERFAGLPYRLTEAFADGELNHEHIVIAWWIVSHITPPTWRYARTISALAREIRWEEETGKSQRTLQRRCEELGTLCRSYVHSCRSGVADTSAMGWLQVIKPPERSRKPWIFKLGKVALERQGDGLVAVDSSTGEVLAQPPSRIEGPSRNGLQDVDVDIDKPLLDKEHRGSGRVPR